MGDADTHVRDKPVEDVLNGRQLLHFIMEEEDLSAAVEFVAENGFDFLLVEENDFRLDRNAVRRGR